MGALVADALTWARDARVSDATCARERRLHAAAASRVEAWGTSQFEARPVVALDAPLEVGVDVGDHLPVDRSRLDPRPTGADGTGFWIRFGPRRRKWPAGPNLRADQKSAVCSVPGNGEGRNRTGDTTIFRDTPKGGVSPEVPANRRVASRGARRGSPCIPADPCGLRTWRRCHVLFRSAGAASHAHVSTAHGSKAPDAGEPTAVGDPAPGVPRPRPDLGESRDAAGGACRSCSSDSAGPLRDRNRGEALARGRRSA